MALKHARPCEVIDVKPLGPSLAMSKTCALFKTEHCEVIRIVMKAGKVISEHEAPGEIILHCLEGRIEFTAAVLTAELGPGEMLYLEAEKPHTVRCIEDASSILTIVSKR